MNLDIFTEFMKQVEQEQLDLYGIEILREGRAIFRKMLRDDLRYPIYSAAKTVTASAVGLAQNEGKLDISRPLADYLTAEQLSYLPAKNSGFRSIPLSRFLTMSVSGYPFRPGGENWMKTVLSADVDYSAPPVFHYTNVQAYLVGVACENAAEQPLMDYLTPRFWEPLGIPVPDFQTDPQGNFYGATGMSLTVHQLSLVGQVYLQGGAFNGRQILPADWVRAATSRQISNSDGGYGYFIWHGENHFAISGKWGQKCLCFPEKQLMITYMGDMPEDSGKMLRLAHSLAERL